MYRLIIFLQNFAERETSIDQYIFSCELPHKTTQTKRLQTGSFKIWVWMVIFIDLKPVNMHGLQCI